MSFVIQVPCLMLLIIGNTFAISPQQNNNFHSLVLADSQILQGKDALMIIYSLNKNACYNTKSGFNT
jgi:hypothetical protein